MSDENWIHINQHLRIPESELRFRFSTSGGPGGQHANRSETRVTLLFDVAGSPSLPEYTRARLMEKLANRLDKEGVLRVDVQDSRSQHQNRETAIARFQAILAHALIVMKKRRPSKPGRAQKQRRLDEKKRQGKKKQDRSQRWQNE